MLPFKRVVKQLLFSKKKQIKEKGNLKVEQSIKLFMSSCFGDSNKERHCLQA